MSRQGLLKSIKGGLESIGYDSRWVKSDYSFAHYSRDGAETRKAPLAAFSASPFTYRNACVVVAFSNGVEGEDAVERYRNVGAPLIIEVKSNDTVLPWENRSDQVKPIGKPFPVGKIDETFGKYQSQWNPEAIDRVKNPRKLPTAPRQLELFDSSLIPTLEKHFQKHLKELLENAFQDTAAKFQDLFNEAPDPRHLFPFLFRFVTAKIFMDRADARNWDNLSDPRSIFDKAEEHCGSGLLEYLPKSYLKPKILEAAWDSVSSSLQFQNLSVPDLAAVYEETFITPETRKELGTHSTPHGLADYIVQHLPWEEIPVNERTVFEPFCGHGIFLASAMERLREDLPSEMTPAKRHDYFRKMLTGVELDPLALEVCRLVLTLTDYPNHNNWDLHCDNVFTWDKWDSTLKNASCVLANPPYEAFSQDERSRLNAIKMQKPTELLRRIMQTPPNLMGVVLPQSFLSSHYYREINRQIAGEFSNVQIVEIPQIFQYADQKTVAVIASGLDSAAPKTSISYTQISPKDVTAFLKDFKVSTTRTVARDRKLIKDTLWVPPESFDLSDYATGPLLGVIAEICPGIQWRARTDGKSRSSEREDVASDAQLKGYHLGVEKARNNLSQFHIQRKRFLSLRSEDQNPRVQTFRRRWDKPKFVVNAARFERQSPWRIACWPDSRGLAFTKNYFCGWLADGISEYAVAAILNSPIANQFSFLRDLDRHNHISTLRELPLPDLKFLEYGSPLCMQSQSLVENTDWLEQNSTVEFERSIVALDAAVLDAYELPSHIQRQLLDQFARWKRPISVDFKGYFPDHFTDPITLSDFVKIQYDWEETNDRRCDLIDKNINGELSSEEQTELEHLQHLADLAIRLKAPRPLDDLDGMIEKLKEEGKWVEPTLIP